MLNEHDINDTELNKEYSPTTHPVKLVNNFSNYAVYVRIGEQAHRISAMDTLDEARAYCKSANTAADNKGQYYYYILEPKKSMK